jgi:hypothetical protein
MIETKNLPALQSGDASKLGIRIDDHGMAHGPQHRQVGL